jgi:hypothetical protein
MALPLLLAQATVDSDRNRGNISDKWCVGRGGGGGSLQETALTVSMNHQVINYPVSTVGRDPLFRPNNHKTYPTTFLAAALLLQML